METALRDGTPVLIRKLCPEDADLIRIGFEQLSDRSRQFRFLRAMPKLSDSDLDAIIHPDRDGDLAIGALALGAVPAAPAGLARYVCLPDRPDRAEVAVTVVDRYQGRGLGTLLVAVLSRLACKRGLAAFVGLVSARNRRMRALFAELGARPVRQDGGEIEYEMPLHIDPADYPATPAEDAMRRAARLVAAAGPA